MSNHSISNGELIITVAECGAELKSVKDVKTEREYMWQADPAFWARTSPLLFPVVGSFRDKKFSYNGKTYSMGRHGFARDYNFSVKSKSEKEIRFLLCDNEKTREIYPFNFELEVGYILAGRRLRLLWSVTNKGANAMHFSIGAHPAFNCELGKDYLLFDKESASIGKDALTTDVLNSDGTIAPRVKEIPLENSRLLMTDELFSEDALILKNEGEQKIAIVKPNGKKIVQVEFTTPLVGLWSPTNKHAPFVCIEPWYGCSDREDFSGTLEQREFGNTIQSGETFEREYSIEFF